MSGRDPEYDRFGPWVLEISDEDPPPPLFVPYLTRTEPALLSLKIPRKIARRDAHPGMDLYDYMVSLYADDMVILRRVEERVDSETLRYQDVQHLQVTDELLRGNVRLSLVGHAYDLPFNTVSRDEIARLVDIIRERYVEPDAAGMAVMPRTEHEPTTEGLSFYFERLLADALQLPDMHLLAAQSTVSLGAGESSIARRALFGIASRRLLESIHLTDGRELRILGRGRRYAWRWQSVYGKDTLYVPIANLADVSWDDRADNADKTSLTLQTAGGTETYPFTRGEHSLDRYRDYLSSLRGITRRR